MFLIQQKAILFAILIAKYFNLIETNEKYGWINYCVNDYKFCSHCFAETHPSQQQADENCCTSFLNDIELNESIDATINSIFGHRQLQYGTLIRDLHQQHEEITLSSLPIVLKHLTDFGKLHQVKFALCKYLASINDSDPSNNATGGNNVVTVVANDGGPANAGDDVNDEDIVKNCDNIWKNMHVMNVERIEEGLKYIFDASERVDGIKQCPNGINQKFVRTFNKFQTNLLFWIFLHFNPEIVLLKTLNGPDGNERFSKFIPKLYAWCGFVYIESFMGISLYEFYKNPFYDRIYLASQLLHAAFEFSYGINGFR